MFSFEFTWKWENLTYAIAGSQKKIKMEIASLSHNQNK